MHDHKKQNTKLQHLIIKIQTQLRSDLAIGSGNKKEDLIRTANWSGSAIEYARMDVKHSTTDKKYQPHFTTFKKKPEQKDPALEFAIYGSRGLAARGGNCQEYVGLAIYHLIKSCNIPSLKIVILEMDDCFDHALLKVSTENESFYYDPWMEIHYPQNSSKLKETAEKIVEGLKHEMSSTTDKTEQSEIMTMLKECENKIKKANLKLHQISQLQIKNFPQYQKLFEQIFESEMKAIFPSNPHLSR